MLSYFLPFNQCNNGRALIYSLFSVRMFVLDLQPLYCENIAFSADLITLVNKFKNSFHSQNICIYLWIYDEYLHPFKCQMIVSFRKVFFFCGVFFPFLAFVYVFVRWHKWMITYLIFICSSRFSLTHPIKQQKSRENNEITYKIDLSIQAIFPIRCHSNKFPFHRTLYLLYFSAHSIIKISSIVHGKGIIVVWSLRENERIFTHKRALIVPPQNERIFAGKKRRHQQLISHSKHIVFYYIRYMSGMKPIFSSFPARLFFGTQTIHIWRIVHICSH